MGKADNKKKEKGRFRGRALRGSIGKDNDQKEDHVNSFNNFDVLFSNVDTLNHDKLQELRVRIDSLNKKPILIALCETKPKNLRFERNMAEYNLDGYDLLPLNMGKEDLGRGMIMYIQTGLKYSPVNMKTEFCESISVEIDINKGDKLLDTSVYRSPSSNRDECDKLDNLFREISNKQYSHILIMGDFNYPGINWTNLTTETDIGDSQYEFIETVRDCFYYQHIKEPTRGRGSNTHSCIDLVFSNEECMISDINLESPLGKSDHSVISLHLTLISVAMVHQKQGSNMTKGII